MSENKTSQKNKKINKMTNEELVKRINDFKEKNETNSRYYIHLVKQAIANGLNI